MDDWLVNLFDRDIRLLLTQGLKPLKFAGNSRKAVLTRSLA